MASKIELTKTLINALLNENRKSAVTPSQLATLYQHLLGMIEENDPYTKEETDELIKTAKSAVLKTLRLQWFNTGNSIGLFTAKNEELTRVSGVARQKSLDALRAVLSQPREFFINDTADKFDDTADSYFTEDIDGETIQFIDEEFTAVGADALTLPVSICQGGKTIATFPAAFSRRLINEKDPTSWHAYEGHAIFESAGSVWKFLYNAVPRNNEQSLELVKISSASAEIPTLKIYLPPEVTDKVSGKQISHRYWKGHSDQKNIYWQPNYEQAQLALAELTKTSDLTNKTVLLYICSSERPYIKDTDFAGHVVFEKIGSIIRSQDFRVTKNGLDYKVAIDFYFDNGKCFKMRYFAYPLRPKPTVDSFRQIRGICPTGIQQGLKYNFCDQFKLNVSKKELNELRETGHLFKKWYLRHIWNFITPDNTKLIEKQVWTDEDYGISVKPVSISGIISVNPVFNLDTERKMLKMSISTEDKENLAGLDIRIHNGFPFYKNISIANIDGTAMTGDETSSGSFQTAGTPVFPENLLNLVNNIDQFGRVKTVANLVSFLMEKTAGQFQLQRYRLTKHKNRPEGLVDVRNIKWSNIYDGGRNSNMRNGIFRIRYAKTRRRSPGPWVYFKLNIPYGFKILKIC